MPFYFSALQYTDILTRQKMKRLYPGHIISVLLLAIFFIFTMEKKFFESCITLGLHYTMFGFYPFSSTIKVKREIKFGRP